MNAASCFGHHACTVAWASVNEGDDMRLDDWLQLTKRPVVTSAVANQPGGALRGLRMFT